MSDGQKTMPEQGTAHTATPPGAPPHDIQPDMAFWGVVVGVLGGIFIAWINLKGRLRP